MGTKNTKSNWGKIELPLGIAAKRGHGRRMDGWRTNKNGWDGVKSPLPSVEPKFPLEKAPQKSAKNPLPKLFPSKKGSHLATSIEQFRGLTQMALIGRRRPKSDSASQSGRSTMWCLFCLIPLRLLLRPEQHRLRVCVNRWPIPSVFLPSSLAFPSSIYFGFITFVRAIKNAKKNVPSKNFRRKKHHKKWQKKQKEKHFSCNSAAEADANGGDRPRRKINILTLFIWPHFPSRAAPMSIVAPLPPFPLPPPRPSTLVL